MYIRVYATPDARKESVQKRDDTSYDISVREPRARNLVNERIRTLLARECGVPLHHVRLVSGHRSPSKVFAVEESF